MVAREGRVIVRKFARSRTTLPLSVDAGLRRYLERQVGTMDLLILVGQFHRELPPLARMARRLKLPYVMLPLGVYSSAMFASIRSANTFTGASLNARSCEC